MPIAKAELELFGSLVDDVLDRKVMDARLEAPWFRDFFSGYSIGFMNGVTRGELARDLTHLCEDGRPNDPEIFVKLGWQAAQGDYALFLNADNRALPSLVRFVEDWDRHREHWLRYKSRNDWQSREQKYAQFDREFDDMIEDMMGGA